MGITKIIMAAALGAWFCAGAAAADSDILAQADHPAGSPGAPSYKPPPSYETPDDCLKAGWGVTECRGFDSWWRSNQKGEAPTPPPAYKETNDCLKAGWGVTECQGFDTWWKKNESVETAPNPNQHQGCGGYGVTECPPGGGGGGRH